MTALVEALEITAEDLLALENLGDILKYHVVAGEAMSTDLSDGQMIATLLGPDVTVTINEEGVFINNAQVTVADIEADNGVVHVIDAVLLPPAPPTNTILDVIQNSPEHMLLAAAVDAAGLAGALSGEDTLTVFAPTDAPSPPWWKPWKSLRPTCWLWRPSGTSSSTTWWPASP